MSSNEIYKAEVVGGIIDYYADLLFHYPTGLTIRQRLEKLATHLWHAYKNDNPVVKNEINNYHPNFIGKNWDQIKHHNFSEDDAYISIAKQYGYFAWTAVPETEVDVQFEQAIDMLLTGNQSLLNQLILNDPTLITRKSQYAHQASLLHYVGSNGFELYRQVVPMNLPELLDFLIKAGCDKAANMNVYGGQFTMIELLNTSIHPKKAELLEELNRVYTLHL